MGRSLRPILCQELQNLDKDADSRKSAMKALNLYVKDLDSKDADIWVSETKDAGSSYGEYTISLYEVLARVHGPKIAPQIDNIMSAIIKTLTSSAGSFALHQACSKVVPAIARYGIDPTMAEDKKRHIIHSLCKPLSDSLLGSQESLSSGSALCLKALVDSDNWRFASNDMVNEVCQRVAAAIEKPTQPNSHMGLVLALAKHNSLIVEAYARLLLHSGLRILNAGVSEGNCQKKLSAIQMVNDLMMCLDPKSISSEVRLIMEEMDRCRSDQMAYVRGAAFEALLTASRITIMEKGGSNVDKELSSVTPSDFVGRENSLTRNMWGSGDPSLVDSSPESLSITSFAGHDDFFTESPISLSQFFGDDNNNRRSTSRQLWRRDENSVVDVSLKDGLYSEVTHGSAIDNHDLLNSGDDYSNGSAAFFQGSPLRSTTLSPQRSRSQINVDNLKSMATPRKLIRSLQDDLSSESIYLGVNQDGVCRSPSCSKCNYIPTSRCERNGISPNLSDSFEFKGNDKLLRTSESVSSTDDIISTNCDHLPMTTQDVSEVENQSGTKLGSNFKSSVGMMCGFAALLFAVFVCLLWGGDQSEGRPLVPT